MSNNEVLWENGKKKATVIFRILMRLFKVFGGGNEE